MEKMDYENDTGWKPRKTSFFSIPFLIIIVIVILFIAFGLLYNSTAYRVPESIPWNLADPGPRNHQHSEDLWRLISICLNVLWHIQHPQDAPAPPTPTLPISRNDIIICNTLGHGSYGQVYGGYLHGKPCAMKTVINSSNTEVKEFFHEGNLLNHINHENIITSFGFFNHTYYPFIFMEVADCSLLKYLEDYHANKIEIPNKVKMEICHDIAKGAVELRRFNIVHRDLAARNILIFLDDNKQFKRAKIADLGMAREMVKQGPFEHGYESERGYFSEETDVFSFGEIMKNIFAYRPFSANTVVPDGIYKMINNCCNPNPLLRPTFLAIFSELAFNILKSKQI